MSSALRAAMIHTPHPDKGIISWFAHNHVAANLLMLGIIFGGFLSIFFAVHVSLFPVPKERQIMLSMSYPGASAEEIEDSLAKPIERVLQDLDGIKEITSVSADSQVMVTVEAEEGADLQELRDEIKLETDNIQNFPENAEELRVFKGSAFSNMAMQVQLYGDIEFINQVDLALEIRDEIRQLEDVSEVQIYGDRNYEILVEIPEEDLHKYGLTLRQVADVIARSSVNLPGGAIRSDTGDILLRTQGQAYRQHEFENIVLLSETDGTRLTLGDVATIRDGLEENEGFIRFDGQPGIGMAIFNQPDENILASTAAIKKYLEKKRAELPQGVFLEIWADSTRYLEGRLGLMYKNFLLGGFLVLMLLALFLDLRVAFWVVIGLPVCVLGTAILMPLEVFSITVNLLSLFGFILVLGIVVDDAIVIGESAHHYIRSDGHSTRNVVRGAQAVALPATFGVLTTIVAFVPFLVTSGDFAPFPRNIGFIVICCLVFSLIESKLILPSHLARARISSTPGRSFLGRIQQGFARLLAAFIAGPYRRFLLRCLRYRYIVCAAFTSLLILAAGLFGGGVVRFVGFPEIPGEYLTAEMEMYQGSTRQELIDNLEHLREQLKEVENRYQEQHEGGFLEHVFIYSEDGLEARMMVELAREEERFIAADEITEQWRALVGEFLNTRRLSFSAVREGPGGEPIAFLLSGKDEHQLDSAVEELSEKLRSYEGIYDVHNSSSNKVDELSIVLKPAARNLGLTLVDVGSQIRNAYYGAEAQRIQRGINEVRVLVRYPQAQRSSPGSLQDMYIRTAQGEAIPLRSVAEVHAQPGSLSLQRIDGKRAVFVSASADLALVDPPGFTRQLAQEYLPELMRRHPGVEYQFYGGSLETTNTIFSLLRNLGIAVFVIYALLAIPLRSYTMPLMIMGVIPFGFIGAMLGHMIMGMDISMLSVFGIVAVAGVVVNDSLILVDFINRARLRGAPLAKAVLQAGSRRFRPILLTSLTTFFGLLPITLETSVQAQFIIPMAVSLSFGILFATVITLVMIPALYMVLDDWHSLFRKRRPTPPAGDTAGDTALPLPQPAS